MRVYGHIPHSSSVVSLLRACGIVYSSLGVLTCVVFANCRSEFLPLDAPLSCEILLNEIVAAAAVQGQSRAPRSRETADRPGLKVKSGRRDRSRSRTIERKTKTSRPKGRFLREDTNCRGRWWWSSSLGHPEGLVSNSCTYVPLKDEDQGRCRGEMCIKIEH